jgi:hypothetical protein
MKPSVQLKIVRVFLCLTFLWVCSGCASIEKLIKPKSKEAQAEAAQPGAESKAKPAKEAQPDQLVHTVRWSGETLSIIAKWYTGSFQNWKVLADANPGLDPDRIRIGDMIVIPTRIVKTREPMPRDFLPTSSPQEKPKDTEKEEPKAETEELELFGPKK